MTHPVRTPILAGLVTGVVMSLFAVGAHADDSTVEAAIASRPELSQFNLALHKTGVINELNGTNYTVFAPNNAAFAKLTKRKYPCLYSPECTDEVAEIVRNHIVPGEVHVSDSVRGDAVFSIDQTHLHVFEPHKGRYTVEGKKIVSQNQLAGNMLYVIDGVIADKDELSDLESLPPQPIVFNVPTTKTEETVTREYRYSPNGAPTGEIHGTTTTTVTRDVPVVATVPATSGY